jgi:hypothetical protein
MIDFIKIYNLPVKPEKLLNNCLLTFPLSNVANTGEVLNRAQIAYYNGLQFIVKGENSGLKGSLHKYWHNLTNWQDFYLNQVQEAIKELTNKFEFEPENSVANFVEIGLNIPVWCNPTELIKMLVIYKNKPFEPLPVEGKGFGRVCKTSQFDIKIYNKSLQYNLPHHLLRVEIKVKRMEFLAPDRGKKKIEKFRLTLADLCKPELYERFLTLILSVLNDILFFDANIADTTTNINDHDLFMQGRYSDFWNNMPRSTKNRKIKRFKELAGGEKIKLELKKLIIEKWNELTTLQAVTPERINRNSETANCGKMERINTTINSQFVPRCIVTGLQIHNQRPETKNLTPKGVRWYFENKPEMYKNELEILLTQKWLIKHRSEPMEVFFNEIAHQIRNRKQNPKNNTRNNTKKSFRNIEKKGLKLFPTMDLVNPAKLKFLQPEFID